MIIFIVLFAIFHFSTSANDYIIDTSYGKLKGYSLSWPNGKNIVVFKKIPFASPPLKELRFALPRPPKPWNGIRDATKYGPACLSNSSTTKSPQKWVDEDCLHVNVFTNEDCIKSANCAVAFYVHGGGLQFDSAVMFNDSLIIESFASRDVIFITVGFRLGIFSHLVFEGDDVVHKNIGIYDLLAGLEFMHSEIRFFGGNKSHVTLYGHSYGGGIAVQLATSKKIDPKKRLFQQVVAMSPGIYLTDVEPLKEYSTEFARRLGCLPPPRRPPFSRNFHETFIVRCLRSKDQFELLRMQRQMEEEDHDPPGGIIRDEILFPKETMVDFLSDTGPIRLLIGTTTKEMDMDPNPEPPNHQLFTEFNFQNIDEVRQKFYDDWKNNRLGFNHKFDTQYMFQVIPYTALSNVKNGGISYLYSYRNPKHPFHTDDLSYLLGVHSFEPDNDEKQIGAFYREMFSNFVKTGVPDNHFEPLNATLMNYLYIDFDNETGLKPHMENDYEHEVISYWTQMHVYDRALTKNKMIDMRDQTIEMIPSDFAYSSYSYLRTCAMFLSALSFLLGFCVAKCCLNNKKREFIVIGSDSNNYEKLPLYSNLM